MIKYITEMALSAQSTGATTVTVKGPNDRTIECTDEEIDEFLVSLPYGLPITNPTMFAAFTERLKSTSAIANIVNVAYWGVTGRIPDADEDTACVFGPCTEEDARAQLVTTLYNERYRGVTERAAARKSNVEKHGVDAYVTSMFASNTPIIRVV